MIETFLFITLGTSTKNSYREVSKHSWPSGIQAFTTLTIRVSQNFSHVEVNIKECLDAPKIKEIPLENSAKCPCV